MYSYPMVTSPDILFQIDLWVEAFSLVVALFISAFSLSAYLITKQVKQQRFSLAFLLIAIGIFARAVLNSWVQFETLPVPLRGYIDVTYLQGFMLVLSMLFIIAGYVTLIFVTENIKQPKIMMLLLLLAPFTALVAHEFYVLFHLMAMLLVGMLILHFFSNYRRERSSNALLVMLAFGALFVANILFAFTILSYVFYLAGTIVRLVGFLLFLVALVMIFLGRR